MYKVGNKFRMMHGIELWGREWDSSS